MNDDKKASAPAPTTGANPPGIVGMVLPAVLAAAAAFGGAKLSGMHRAAPAAPVEHVEAPKPPGPTLALDPFVLTIPDQARKIHPMKVTLAIEFDAKAREDEFKALVPRIRDAALSYLRTLTYEDAVDPAESDKMRPEILGRLKAAGTDAERILITDLVVQ